MQDFFALIDKRSATECWPWLGYRAKSGHGIYSGRWKAHRISYRRLVGEIPAGLVLDHLCQNPSCVNPDHLEPVTLAENTRRKWAMRTHCKNGHELAVDGQYQAKNGRPCKPCTLKRCREYYARKVAARG